MLIILFGLPASGKNYVGRILAEDFGFCFHDADDNLPKDMREAIVNHQIATDDMRDRHLNAIADSIRVLQAKHEHVAIAGAFFKARNRQWLTAQFPDLIWVLVETTPELQHNRLVRRQNHLADAAYAAKIFSQFEPPQHPHFTLHNTEGREAVVGQVKPLIMEQHR